MIAAVAATTAIRPEPRDARLLIGSASALVAVTPQGVHTRMLENAQDGAYSPDGTMVGRT